MNTYRTDKGHLQSCGGDLILRITAQLLTNCRVKAQLGKKLTEKKYHGQSMMGGTRYVVILIYIYGLVLISAVIG